MFKEAHKTVLSQPASKDVLMGLKGKFGLVFLVTCIFIEVSCQLDSTIEIDDDAVETTTEVMEDETDTDYDDNTINGKYKYQHDF